MYFDVFSGDLARQSSTDGIRDLFETYERALARSDRLPSETDLPSAILNRLAPHLMRMRPLADDDFEYMTYGEAIARMSGFDMTGKRTSDFKGEVGVFFCNTYLEAVTSRQPLLTIHRATYAVEVHSWERLICPMMDAEGLYLLVLNRVRETREDLFGAVLGALTEGIMAIRFVRERDGVIVNGRVTLANRALCRMLRRPEEDVMDQLILDVLPDLQARGHWQRYMWVDATQQPLTFEADISDAHTKAIYQVNLSPIRDGVLVAVRDIHQTKLMQRRLAELEKRAPLTKISAGAPARQVSSESSESDPIERRGNAS
ncbi:MAG: PAS domain-containing protein [Beijerinckiaceae bacterium]